MLEPVRPEAVLPNRALCLQTSSHYFIVNKTSLEAFRRGERMGRVGFDSRIFFPWMAGHPCLTLRARSLSRRSGEYRKGMIPARPLHQGGCGSVWDPEPSKERVGDWGGPATVWSLLCVAETRATRPNGEWGYSTRRQPGPCCWC